MSLREDTKDLRVAAVDVGKLSVVPPTFLERWGVTFVACAGGWILLVGSGMLVYFCAICPPSQASPVSLPIRCGTH